MSTSSEVFDCRCCTQDKIVYVFTQDYLFNIWQTIVKLWHFYVIGQIVIVVNGQRLYIHLVALISTVMFLRIRWGHTYLYFHDCKECVELDDIRIVILLVVTSSSQIDVLHWLCVKLFVVEFLKSYFCWMVWSS